MAEPLSHPNLRARPGESYCVSTDDVPASERLSYWRDVVCRDTYSVTPRGWREAETFRARIEIRDCGRFGFAEVDSDETHRERSRADIASDGADHVVVYRARRPAIVFDDNLPERQLNAGDICVLSVARRFQLRAEDGLAFRTLIIPQPVLSPFVAGGRVREARLIDRQSALGAMLSGTLDLAWSQAPRLASDIGDSLLENVSRLVALAFDNAAEGKPGEVSQRAARLAAVRKYVEANLGDSRLTPARTGRALGLSLRQLHSLFAGEAQTFVRFVTTARLQACWAALQNPASARRSTTDIAFGFGFRSMATFYRTFEAAYSASPAEVRANCRRDHGAL